MPDFIIAIPDWALGASVGATLDVLSVANRVATTLGKKGVDWKVLGSAKQVRLTNGFLIDAVPIEPGLRLGHGVLVIPGIGLDHPDVIPSGPAHSRGGITARYEEAGVLRRMAMPDAHKLAQLAKEHHDRGGLVCASCSGVLVLGMAGLLDARKVTTHWQLAGFIGKHFPEASMDATCMVVEDQRIVTGGAAMAQMDLMLYLIRKVIGRDVADLTMKYMLIDSRPTQARYMVWSHLPPTDDTVQKFESLIESSLPDPITVSEVARRLHMTEKTLARRVFKAIGRSPMSLIQSVRMQHAQHLLDMTDLPIDEVAIRVGYSNATALRKLTMKMANLTPAMLRRIA
ncbi:MAG: GlxA family transcriptional regulator [Polaromonas sp.]